MLTQTAIRASAPPTYFAAPPVDRVVNSRPPRDLLATILNLIGAVVSYRRNTELFGENEPADYLYKVVSGGVRTYKILSDGRRQISAFYLPRDMFGLEFAGEYSCSAEAISDAKVLVVNRKTLTALAGRDAEIARELFVLTARELQRVHKRVLLLVKTAQERVASFLVEMAERGSAGNAIELPMSRQDIADYLGLTIETVSRTLTSLETCAAIEVSSRRIVVRNRSALNRMNG